MSKLKRKQRVDKLIYKAKNCEFFAHGPKKRKPLVHFFPELVNFQLIYTPACLIHPACLIILKILYTGPLNRYCSFDRYLRVHKHGIVVEGHGSEIIK